MLEVIRDFFTNRDVFARTVRGLLLAGAVGASTAAGAEALREVGADSPVARLGIAVVLAGLGGAVPVGEKNAKP